MNFYASHQRPLQRRSYTGRPSRPAEGRLRGHQEPCWQPSGHCKSNPVTRRDRRSAANGKSRPSTEGIRIIEICHREGPACGLADLTVPPRRGRRHGRADPLAVPLRRIGLSARRHGVHEHPSGCADGALRSCAEQHVLGADRRPVRHGLRALIRRRRCTRGYRPLSSSNNEGGRRSGSSSAGLKTR